ncbi:MAG: adenylate/guanylate cyclase domain-containing protein [Gammaproteobacteria bacterium]
MTRNTLNNRYLRRPDREFWLELLRAPPRPTETASVRRERLARYALGACVLFTLPYVAVSAWLDFSATWLVVLINAVCALLFGIGMWMASLAQHKAARLLLMVTLEAQIAILVWLTGPELNMVVFTLVTAALARVLFTIEEHGQQIVFIGIPVLTLIAGMTMVDASHVDFSALPDWLLSATRVLNALLSLVSVILILGVFEREVLRSENELVTARERSDTLLHAVLPRKIADQLRNSPAMIADRHPEVTVLFADIAGFTPWSSRQDPETVVAMLEKVFSRFDAKVQAAGAEKIKTIGDAYMVISGAPDPRADHAQVIARLALELLEEVRHVREETGIDINLRVGIHTGEVIAGVIGAMRFSYDVWGDTVNTASRMESHGEPGRIQLSADTRQRLGDDFRCELRGVVNIKGKGEMETWWLTAATVQPSTNRTPPL